MPGSWSVRELPNLNDANCVVTSPRHNGYNCIAWAVGDSSRWWWPSPLPGSAYWPRGVPLEESIQAFIQAFGTKGFTPCADSSLEDGVEKIALFANQVGGLLVPTHAALQLESGEWTSKLGPLEDIMHITSDAVNGPLYGQAVQFLSRARTPLQQRQPLAIF